MTAAPEATEPAPPLRAGEVLTLSFSDANAQLCGQARVRLGEADEPASALVAVFAGDQPIALARAGVPAAHPAPDGLQVGPLALTAPGPGGDGWTVRFAGDERGEGALDLLLEPQGPPLRLAAADHPGTPSAAVPTRDLEQPCTVSGALTVSGRATRLDGRGQVARLATGATGANGALTRELAGWLEDGAVIAVRATRPAGGVHHEHEQVLALLAEPGSEHVGAVHEARLTTAYDESGALRRAGVELWEREDSDYPRRAAGEVVCAATLDAEAGNSAVESGRWDVAFLQWRMDGRRGIGPYSLLRR